MKHLLLLNPPTRKSHMARRTKSHRRSSPRRRVSKNPPAMTPARRAKIGAKIRALHRSGFYKKSRRAAPARKASPARRAGRAIRRSTSSMVVRRSSRPSRRSGSFGIRTGGGGPIGSFKAMFSRQTITVAAGAAGSGLITSYVLRNYGASLPGLGTQMGNVLWRLAIPATAAWAVRRYNKNLSDGLLIGGVVMAINTLLQNMPMFGGAPAPAVAATGAYPVSPASPLRSFGEYLDPVGASVFNSESAFESSAWQ